MELDRNTNNLVSYSRAGDVFHYRWAARRCLRLINPNSNLNKIVIEGSLERKKAGEYVIDVSEYYSHSITNKIIEYYQLKHTTVQHYAPFTLSKLKNTIIGFSKRYRQHKKEKSKPIVSFTIITNRKIDNTFKENLQAIIYGYKVNNRFSNTLKKYTKLDGKELISFCSLLNLEDSEGDYNTQKEELRVEMARLQPGLIDSAQVSSIISLVQEKVLPDSNGIILKEDVLRPFGVTSEKQLFPAPPMFEDLEKITIRDQYSKIIDTIIANDKPIIIQAEGGVGKSVFSQYLQNTLPDGSLGIAYDCFGSGKYRSRSEPRHRHRDALVQISNELAALGYCERILVKDTTQENDIMRGFLSRINTSLKSLKNINESAILVILIDAADNAEMAAQEFGDSCFASELLREEFPNDCKLVLLCRPERTALLKPPSSILKLNFKPFSREETFENLKKWFPSVNKNQASEFHRLTSGNPRAQMNSIAAGHSSINKLLEYLIPYGATVEQQIENQLNTAILKIKDNLPENHQTHINKICRGLASLPPNIPIEILSQVSEVSPENIKSFVSDIGRSLWMTDSSVHFRDEPTETWFRNTYIGSQKDFCDYINILEPLASKHTYIAQVLPQLYLKADQYDKLINIALSDRFLPGNNPIDTRNVLVYRLQFAFKAALRAEKFDDAIKLSLRAGEEVAGDERQQNLFYNNVDLLSQFQDKLKIQEIAFKGILKSEWEGSENVYTASLLSNIKEFHGEASGYLRSALNWLNIYFKESKNDSNNNHNNKFGSNDILEIALTILNLKDAQSCLKFLNSLIPKKTIFWVTKKLIKQLIDTGRFDEVNVILNKAYKNKYHTLAIVSELAKIGNFAEAIYLNNCLKQLSKPKTRVKKPHYNIEENIIDSIVAFLEVCLNRNMDSKMILKVLDYYVPEKATRSISTRFNSKSRILYLKALSIRKILSKKLSLNLEILIPDEYKLEKNKRDYSEEIRDFKELVGSLYPLFLLRMQIILGHDDDLNKRIIKIISNSRKAHANRYRRYDDLPTEIAEVLSSILIYCIKQKSSFVKTYYNKYLKENSSFKIYQRINLLRVGCRSNHLNSILEELEESTYKLIKNSKIESPEEIANQYISLSRALVLGSKDDATIYFEEAINVVSKFGDELIQRWEAVVALGKRAASKSSNELAYRFIRCAELVGEYVYREKYWNRSEALVTCTKMSTQIGISTLSRWRDRDIGRFKYQLQALLFFLVKSKTIRSGEAWSMARFLSDHELDDFLEICLENEPSKSLRNIIFKDACELLRKEGTTLNIWRQIKSIADEYQISDTELNDFFNLTLKEVEKPKPVKGKKILNKKFNKRWNRVFENIETLKPENFSSLQEKFLLEFENDKLHQHKRMLNLYKEILNRIKSSEIFDYIELMLSSESIEYYDFKEVLVAIPSNWKNKVSFKRRWASIIFSFGSKYSRDLVSSYTFNSVVNDLSLNDNSKNHLRQGIFKGLSSGQELANASILFGFVEQAVNMINEDEATYLVDYALSRFELHIEESFGDGSWSEWLYVSNNTNENIAGFIWSALGSPYSRTRWNACHVVKKLVDFNCSQILDCLIDWMNHNKVDAFGSKDFPFYNLHARQYLLITLLRISIDHPSILLKHRNLFINHTQLAPHIIIQKLSADIALNLEKAFPKTYSPKEISLLKAIGKSRKSIKEKTFGHKVNSYLHEKGLIDVSLDYYFGWDFERYWYEPLGDVFNVSAKQIEEICSNIILKDWRIKTKGGYKNDPRVDLWNNSSYGETSHRHGSYPETDTLNFYLSYHAMLVAAAKLVDNMSITINTNWYTHNPWESWLSRHFLSKQDGKWLADLRGFLPFERPKWIDKADSENWRKSIQEEDFLQSVKFNIKGETWINISGGWTERHDSRYETYSISTALVSKETSDALLMALTTCSDYRDYKLPDYKDSNFEIDSGIFRLEGLIFTPDLNEGIDKLDSYSGNINFPMLTLGEKFLKKLDLLSDTDGKIWYSDKNKMSLKCDAWSSTLKGYDKEPEQSGMRLSASISILKKLCRIYDSNLIIEVNISRNIEYKSRTNKEKYEDVTQNKIYLFSENGRLRSTK